MTNGKLIELLKAFPLETQVVVQGYEGGYDDPVPPKLECVGPGEWESDFWGTYHEGTTATGWLAVFIGRGKR